MFGYVLIGLGLLLDVWNIVAIIGVRLSERRRSSSVVGPQALFYIFGALLLPTAWTIPERLLVILAGLLVHALLSVVTAMYIVPWLLHRLGYETRT